LYVYTSLLIRKINFLRSPTVALVLSAASLLWVGAVVADCVYAKLDEETLVAVILIGLNCVVDHVTVVLFQDLKILRRAYDVDTLIQKDFCSKDVGVYYSETTDRDYMLLELFVGPGLHSRLRAKYPILSFAGHSRQPAYVMNEIANINAQQVLEVGFGRGYCSFYLAGMLPHVNFTGMDLIPRHVEVANASCVQGGYRNVKFVQGDATVDLSALQGHFDVIFGVEALCHMDHISKVRLFLGQVSKKLRNGGRLVIVDGFRSSNFEKSSLNQQLAMKLAECGFRIRKMPSKADWIQAAAEVGMKQIRDIDLTQEALPFWTLGWRVSRAVLRFPWVVRWVAASSVSREQTAANLLSVASTAHAMRDSGTAEYGVLVLEMQ
jgi:2-polyprenyl-3-methyl-5-hydroxy-6-metoxy-1,4-benzoquinol methylase